MGAAAGAGAGGFGRYDPPGSAHMPSSSFGNPPPAGPNNFGAQGGLN